MFWENRLIPVISRPGKTKKALEISEAHTSTIALASIGAAEGEDEAHILLSDLEDEVTAVPLDALSDGAPAHLVCYLPLMRGLCSDSLTDYLLIQDAVQIESDVAESTNDKDNMSIPAERHSGICLSCLGLHQTAYLLVVSFMIR